MEIKTFKKGINYILKASRTLNCSNCSIRIQDGAFFFLRIEDGKEVQNCLFHGKRHTEFSGSLFTTTKEELEKYQIQIFDIPEEDLEFIREFLQAAVSGKTGKVKNLFSKHPEMINAGNDSGETALHLAARQGHLNTVKALIEAGAEINCRRSNGWTPLHLAACCGELETVKYLVSKGAVCIRENPKETTPMHVAAITGHTDVVRFFINLGIDPNMLDISNSTPLECALRNKRKECAQYLKQFCKEKPV